MASRGSTSGSVLPSLDEMREAVNQRFGFVPLTLAPTGSGKTLTFWIPLLFNEDGITIVITPLIVLGEKNVKELLDVSIAAINLTTDSTSNETFKDIESLKYCVVITSPKRILNDRRFLDLWKSKRFVNKLRSFIFDEAHCISQWSGDFRPDYANVGRLHWMVPARVVFYAASATMPCYVLAHVKTLLQMRSDTREIRLTNDRPNIHLATLEMLDPLVSCHDITRVLRFDGNPPPPPFMVFCNDRKETERLCLYAQSLAPVECVDKLLWFHSGMSTDFRTKTIEKLRTTKIWGVFCTNAAGMGLDLRDIEIVVQWRYTQSLCMLWQRLGRAARDPNKEATGIYMVEPQHTDQRRIRADKKASDLTERAQQKKSQGAVDANSGPSRPTRRRGSRTMRKKSQSRVGRPEVLTQHTADNLIVKEERHESYKVAAMDTYINARQRGICRRKISDEFFGNRPGECLCGGG
ncbi:P-loop containing nucleoside triphosphate hydrolase protein [Lactarius pseudohatsudake]|nr:P-loop containing nucleoside triphosphate hydrolase protein [Lactarius pseudohatsudake]